MASRTVFPLVPRYRLAGLPFGGSPSLRRGHGSEVAGSRSYVRGDPVATIDWRASARLSTARGREEFVVRERYAEEAPRVVVFCDRAPSMALYQPPFPWLSKPDATRAAADLIVRSAQSANAGIAYLDLAGDDGSEGAPYWLPPGGRSTPEWIAARIEGPARYDTDESGLVRGLEFLGRFRSELSSGTFVFVISDFLEADLAHPAWLAPAVRRWEVVPVVIQDPVWEQSFPDAGALVVPLQDPRTGQVLDVGLSARASRSLRQENEERRRHLLAEMTKLALDSVLVDSSDPGDVERAFMDWAAGRLDLRRRR
jgi:uncharacterized protein (DUF58 family)